MTTPTDKLGREIKNGDEVVYPVRRRSTIDLKRATVIGFDGGEIMAVTVGDDERIITVRLQHPDRCAVVSMYWKSIETDIADHYEGMVAFTYRGDVPKYFKLNGREAKFVSRNGENLIAEYLENEDATV